MYFVSSRIWRFQRGNEKQYSKKYRQYNGKKKKEKRTNNDLQNTTQNIKDNVTRTSLKTVSSCYPEGYTVPASYVTPVELLGDKSWMRKGSDYN